MKLNHENLNTLMHNKILYFDLCYYKYEYNNIKELFIKINDIYKYNKESIFVDCLVCMEAKEKIGDELKISMDRCITEDIKKYYLLKGHNSFIPILILLKECEKSLIHRNPIRSQFINKILKGISIFIDDSIYKKYMITGDISNFYDLKYQHIHTLILDSKEFVENWIYNIKGYEENNNELSVILLNKLDFIFFAAPPSYLI